MIPKIKIINGVGGRVFSVRGQIEKRTNPRIRPVTYYVLRLMGNYYFIYFDIRRWPNIIKMAGNSRRWTKRHLTTFNNN